MKMHKFHFRRLSPSNKLDRAKGKQYPLLMQAKQSGLFPNISAK